jgi:antitoxin (DNA-binding transcriptional repressor) of toxin-antitoxin stability system
MILTNVRTLDRITKEGGMRVTASRLRENVYRILDEVIATGVPVEIVRKGAVLRIVPEQRASKLSRLKRRAGFEGDPDDIMGMDWLKEWTELK